MGHHVTRRDFLGGLLAVGAGLAAGHGRAEDNCAPHRALVILLEFPGTSLPVDHAFVADRFRRLDFYAREMSYGKAGVDAHLSGWHRMPEPLTRYAISPINLQVDKSRVVRLIQDAIDAADAANDFSRHDYVVLFLGARFAEYGMVGLCGYPGMLGWQQELGFKTRTGQLVPGGVAIFTASAHLGTLVHDSAHVWGGVKDGKRVVPCLYDHDLQVKHPTLDKGWAEALINMGFWDPMSCHSYKRHLPPPGISSWTKLRLGWLPAEKVRVVDASAPTEVVLGPLEDGGADTLAIRIPLSRARYLLIENRQPIGAFDPHLPGHGVLVMMADDDIGECRHGRAPVRLVNANPARKHLEGAAFDWPEPSTHVDADSGIEIRLLEKIGSSYRIGIARHT